VFVEEEGGRFGVPCLGSRLLTGALDADRARRLTDSDASTLADAADASGFDPARLGADPVALSRIGRFIELHVEQGRLLGAHPVGLATSILAHGRWRITVSGQGNHAGTTEIDDRHDSMLPVAAGVLAARAAARTVSGGRATVGRLTPNPGGTNVIASSVDLWLDARAPSQVDARRIVDDVTAAVIDAARTEGCAVVVREESCCDTVAFDPALGDLVAAVLGDVPRIPTGAGHDAGILAWAGVPSTMLFVRNPTGISHAPAEHAEAADCAAGVAALARVVEHLCR
jgi:N-carbamoyl-L-amino-acid hydrolase